MNQNDVATIKPSSASIKRSRKLGAKLVRCLIWFALLAFLASWFGRYLLIAEILSNFRFQLCIIFAVGLLFIVKMKLGMLLTLLTAVSLCVTAIESAWIYVPASPHMPGPVKLRVMSYNVLVTNTNFTASLKEIRKHDPDVVALLEYANQWHDAADSLTDAYPFYHREPRWHGYGIAVFSKQPFLSHEVVQLTPNAVDNPAIVTKLCMGKQELQIIACHVMSPTNQFRLDLRNKQFKKLAELVNEQSVPTLLVGDFNAATNSVHLQDLIWNTSMRDTRQGIGLQPSWPNIPWPLAIPIDHAFVTDPVHVENRFVGQAHGSDHRPVIVDVSIGESTR